MKRGALVLLAAAVSLLPTAASASPRNAYVAEVNHELRQAAHHLGTCPVANEAGSLYVTRGELDIMLVRAALRRYQHGHALQQAVAALLRQLSRDIEDVPTAKVAGGAR